MAIKWEDGHESFIKLEALRRHCPCAGCKGEMDILGNLYKNPDKPLTPDAFRLVRVARVGGYALQGRDNHFHHHGFHARHEANATHADEIGFDKRQGVFPRRAGEID